MIVVTIYNHRELAVGRKGSFLITIGETFGYDVNGKVDQEVASQLQAGLNAENVSAHVRVAGGGRIEITAGGLKGMFFEERICRTVAEKLRAEGVRATVITR